MTAGTSEKRFFRSGELSLAGDVAGPAGGAPVILLHGGGQTRHSWAGAQRRLAGEGYRVINLDLRGHGESDWAPDGDYSAAVLAGDVMAVIGTLACPPALVGASLGGIAAFYAAASTKSRAAKALVMVDIALRSAQEGNDRIGGWMLEHQGGFATLEDAADAVAAFNPARKRGQDPEGLRKNLRQHADGRFYWHWDPRILHYGRADVLDRRHKLLVEASPGVTIPTLLVRGEHSDVVTEDNVAEMRVLMPQTEVYQVPGAGHMVAGDRNDAFNEGVIAFLHRHHPA